jgi:malonyl-CoA/methylmalonyl-CoA synthetase
VSQSLDDRFRAAAAEHPRGVALELSDRRIEYALLDHAVEDAVSWLQAQHVQPGDRVLILLPKGLAFVVVHLACLRRRAVSLPVNPRSSARELAHIVDDARPALLVSCQELLQLTAGLSEAQIVAVDPDEGPTTGEAAGDDDDAPGSSDASDLACLLYTSGTTGRPKGVMLSHGALAANDAALRTAWEWSADDRLLHVLPLFHVHGLFVALQVALGSGACCRLVPTFDAADTWQQLHDLQATLFMGVPTMYHRLLGSAPASPAAPASMRLFTCGSAPLRPDTLSAFERLTGQRILERYGMTEVGMACSNPYRGERKAGSVGLDLPGVETRLVDPSDPDRSRPVEAGAVGELMIRSQAQFSGYWEQPELTEQSHAAGGWLASGDLGRRDADGYLHLVGRAKELIISGGFNIYPQEVEARLSEHDAVAEAAVFGLEDDDLGEVVVAAVVARPGAAPDSAQLVAHCREQLAHYKCPRQVVILTELPRNAMGKLLRGALPAASGFGD